MKSSNAEGRQPSPLPVPIIVWQDIFVLVDQGTMQAHDYVTVEAMVHELNARYPVGVACLVIIPNVAKPPPEEVRQAILGSLMRMGKKLRCVCWLVEGAGFRAAAVRAVLTGMRLVSRTHYPTHVSADLRDALQWMLPQLENGNERLAMIPDATLVIAQGRRTLRPPVASQRR